MTTTTDRDECVRLTDPYRREVLAHCHRMPDSVDEAEDLVRETYPRARRSCAGYEGRASLRSGQPAVGTYERGTDGVFRAHSVQALFGSVQALFGMPKVLS
jgi:hypothetical protein